MLLTKQPPPLRRITGQSQPVKSTTPAPIKPELRKAFEYQQKGIDSIADKKRVALLWEMRLGKTLVTLRWLRHNNVSRALIVCPLSVIPSWQNECQLENQLCHAFRSSDKKNGMLELFSNPALLQLPLFAITNYEALLATDIANVKKYKWQAVILDESTTIRRPQSKISQLCANSGTFDDVEYKAILSGSPVPESIIDIYQQSKFLFPQGFMNCDNYWKFKARYFYDIGGGKYRCGARALGEIRQGLSDFSIVLTRKDVGIQCEKLYSRRKIDFDTEYRKTYDQVEATFGLSVKQAQAAGMQPSANQATQTQFAIVAQNWLHQMCGGFPKIFPTSKHKLEYLIQLIKDEERGTPENNAETGEASEKVVIWCHFTKEINTVADELYKLYPGQVSKIAGDVALDDRAEIIKDFNNPFGQIKYLVCQLRTARMGLDLSAADTAIYYSNSWHRLDRIQSEDRVIHPSKTKPVYIIDLVTSNSVDEDLLASMAEKKKSTDELLEGAFRNFLKRHNLN